ncbi:TPA: hypothetical protein PC537_001877 [Morganella morganii]|nr:hypothetical protein [Morganella morganii]
MFTGDPVVRKIKLPLTWGVLSYQCSAGVLDYFQVRIGTFDNKHEVIDIPAASTNSGFILPVFQERSTSSQLNTVIPVPAILSGFSTQRIAEKNMEVLEGRIVTQNSELKNKLFALA